MLIDFDVEPYGVDKLKDLLVSRCPVPRYILDAKQHFEYLDSYLRHCEINAATMVVEHQYIDHDFLLDYAGYYVRCFSQYHRWCSRFHFFSNSFDREQFESFLHSGTTESLNEQTLNNHYLGFLVAKPLPETVIGRTCLKTYNHKNGRQFPYVLDYSVNLFGTHLKIKSLPFQEQDTVAAACATSALWTAFHGTGMIFQHEIPSPMAITRSAIERTPTESRAFPAADGLTDLQMAEAVRGVGLDPLVLSAGTNWLLKATAYAYLQARIPVIMNCVVADYHKQSQVLDLSEDLFGHAIALVGYRIDESSPPSPGKAGLLLRASQVTKLYSHDDQVGPFARMEFPIKPVEIANPDDPKNPFKSDWVSCVWGQSSKLDGRIYISEKVLVPLVTTIRIPFDRILNTLVYFDLALEALRDNGISAFSSRQQWDICLITSNDLKHEWLTETTITPAQRKDLLCTALPKFIWRVTACDAQKKLVDFLFDPTDIEQGLMLLKVVGYDEVSFNEFLRLSNVYSNLPEYEEERLAPHGKIWEHLLQLYQQDKSADKMQTQTSYPMIGALLL